MKVDRRNKVGTYIIFIIGMLLVGTVVYSLLEGWPFIDSLYFSTTTLTTIGYGDLHPTKNVTKLFTVFYVLSGVSLALYALSNINAYYFERNKKALYKRFSAMKDSLKKEKLPDKWVVLKSKKPKHYRYLKK